MQDLKLTTKNARFKTHNKECKIYNSQQRMQDLQLTKKNARFKTHKKECKI